MADEFGSYIEGRGYIPGKSKKKAVEEVREAVARPPMTPRPIEEVIGEGVQTVLTKVFNTVPRNKLKESGLD